MHLLFKILILINLEVKRLYWGINIFSSFFFLVYTVFGPDVYRKI